MPAPKAKKGIASVKKSAKSEKYLYVNSDSEEVTPPTNSDEDRENHNPSQHMNTNNGNRRSGHSELKLSNADIPSQLSIPQPHWSSDGRPRQGLDGGAKAGKAGQQGNPDSNRTLEQTLFADFKTAVPTNTNASPPSRQVTERRPATLPSPLQQPNPPRAQHPNPEPLDSSAVPPFSHLRAAEQPAPAAQPDTANNGKEEAFDMSASYIPPSQQRHMRACMVCSIVRTEQQFRSQGCPNCDSFLELAGNIEQIQDCTSQVFEGLMTIVDTSKSWVARAQRLEGYVPGVYAVQVEGVLPEDVLAAVENAGINYIPRDGSVNDALPTET